MKFNVHGGHSLNCRGASGYFDEVTEDRKVKDKVIKFLKNEGHTVYDCTFDGVSQTQNLSGIVRLCNSHTVDLDISIHFNALNGSAHGVEVLCYGSPKKETVEIANKICNRVSKLGFTNRGIKYRNDLYVLNSTKAEAILIECCFCDNKDDAKTYNVDKMAKAIVEGILDKDINKSIKGTDNTEVKKDNNNQTKVIEDAKFFNKKYNKSYYVNSRDGLNIRVGAGIDKSKITTIKNNTKVRCYGYYSLCGKAEWLFISVNGLTGYVSKEYLKG